MTKTRLYFLVLFMMIATVFGFQTRAITTIDHITYNLDTNSGTAQVVRTTYLAYDEIGRIILPPTVKYLNSSYTVTEISSSAFYGLYGLTEIVLPETLKKINEKAFTNCTGLSSITFPASVTEIGSNAFSGCNLTSVVSEAPNPPYAGGSVNPFSEETLRYATLSVPRGSVGIYKQASGWSRFNRIRYIGQVDPTSITMQSTLEMNVESTYTLQATLSPSNVTERDITWSSSNTNIVSVNNNGTLTAKDSGVAKITATTTNGLSAACTVTVVRPVTGLSIKEVGELHVGDSRKLDVTITPNNATDKTLVYSSSNSGVISVDDNGVITAKALGSASITARAKSGVSASVSVTVIPTPVTSIALPTNTTINVGETASLEALIYPTNATYKTLTWTSSNNAVVRVNSSGKLTGVAVGSADVTATAHNGISATVKVNVVPIEVTSIELSASELHLAVGKSTSLAADIKPQNATDRTVTWESSDNEVATVNSAGRVTGVSVGRAVITARASNGLTAQCNVDVDIPVSSISIDYEAMGLTENKVQMKAEEQLELLITINPEDATDKTLTFTSTDPSKASVSDDGVVTANSVGTAIITVTASSGVKTIMTVQVIPTLAEGVTLNIEDAELHAGEELEMAAVITPATTTDKTIIWSSSDSSVAGISQEGVVKAYSLGEAEISATTSNGIVATARITVVATPATGLSVSPVSLTLKVGEEAVVSAEVLPENATNKSIEWTSSDEDVASVDQRGNITAHSEGISVITAMTLDGTYLTASCEVFVEEPAGVDKITADEIDWELFTLSGVKIDPKQNMLPGIYILRNTNGVKKIRIIH